MSYSIDEVRDLLEQCANLPYGPSQIAQVEEIIRHADAIGDRRLMFDARMLGSDAYTFGGEPAKAFVTFSWCLTEFDQTPELFNEWDDEQVRWHYKWIISALRDFPEIPLERTNTLLDDMERRYRLGGHSLHAVYALRWRLARHIGDAEAADLWYEKWCQAPRDENSDCEGCDPTSKVEHLVERGRDTEALELAEPVLAGQLTCHQQPHSMLTELMVPYLRTGQLDKARQAHLRGYRGFRDRLADLFEIGQHIEFCGLTGNEPRGLELIERHLDWLDRAPSPRAAMQFATASAVVLRRLVDAGHGELTVYRRAAKDRPAGDVTVVSLAAALTALARREAARFDARNGTAFCSDEVERRLHAEPLVEYLPLSAVARAVGRRVIAGTSSVGDPTILADLPADIEPNALLDRADHAYLVLDDDRRALALWTAFVDRFGTTPAGADAIGTARALDAAARVAILANHDADAAQKLLTDAVAWYREADREAEARIAETWLGGAICRSGDTDRGLTLITEAVDWLRAHGQRQALTRCELRLAEALGLSGRPAEALAAVDRADEARSCDPSATAALRVELARACCTLSTGRFPETVALARQVRADAEAADRPDIAGLACACLGFALDGVGDQRAAVDAYTTALDTCDDVRLLDRLRAARAHALVSTPRAAEAVDDLVEVVARLVAANIEPESAVAQFDLAIAYHAAGELLDAAEVAETAVRSLERVGEPAMADRCRYRLSRIYVDMDEPELALALLDELVVRLDGYDNLPQRGQIHEDAGRILFSTDRDAAAAARFAAADECYRAAGMFHDAVRACRARAVAQSWADEPLEECARALADADELAAKLPPDEPATTYELAMLDADAARVLANLGRTPDAVERLSTVADRLRSIDAYGEALDVELLYARLLLGLGRLDHGESLLRSVVAGSPRDTPVHRSAVWTLVAVLEETGRADEAGALRVEYGVSDASLVDSDDDGDDGDGDEPL